MTSTPSTTGPDLTSSPRLIQLDFLRGVAILLVLGNHQILEAIPASGPIKVFAWLWHDLGWVGVDLFFVLSGFLIGSLLFNEVKFRETIDVKRFLIRRLFRIWPGYYAFLAFVCLADFLRPPASIKAMNLSAMERVSIIVGQLLPNIFNVQNYMANLRAHTWSLAVEEHFYLMLPFLLLFLIGRSRVIGGQSKAIPALPWVTLALFLCCSGLRFLNVYQHAIPGYFATHLRIDELLFGVLLAYYNCLQPGFTGVVSRHRGALMTLGFASVLGLILVSSLHLKVGVPLMIPIGMLGSGAFLLAMVTAPLQQGLLGKSLASGPARIIAFIGVYSYAIYLWHVDLGVRPIQLLCKSQVFGAMGITRTWLIVMPTLVLLEVLVGMVLTKIIEAPSLALRDRLFPKQTPVITKQEAAQSPSSAHFDLKNPEYTISCP